MLESSRGNPWRSAALRPETLGDELVNRCRDCGRVIDGLACAHCAAVSEEITRSLERLKKRIDVDAAARELRKQQVRVWWANERD